MSRVPLLTLLALDIVEAIGEGRQPEGTRLEDLLNPAPHGMDRAAQISIAALPLSRTASPVGAATDG
jgi:hypothetical protein